MNKNQFCILLLAVIFASFAGGATVQFIGIGSTVNAKEPIVGRFDEIRTKTIFLVGKEDKIRASFYLGNNDSPELVLYDKDGTNRFNFGLAPAGNPGLSFNDANFNKLIDIDTSYENASISIMNSKKDIIWKAPTAK